MMKPTTTSRIVDTYRHLAKVPTPVSAFVRPHPISKTLEAETTWSQRDLERHLTSKFSRTFSLKREPEGQISSVVGVGYPVDVTEEVWRVYSETGQRIAVLRETKGKEAKEEKQYIEVWNTTERVATIDVTAQELHGKVYGDDSVFGSFQFSPCEKYLVYVAEKKRPKCPSFFDPFGKAEIDEAAKKSEGPRGEAHAFVEEWGEQLTGKSRPVLCFLCVETGRVRVLNDQDGEISPATPIWRPKAAWETEDPLVIVYIGYDAAHERLGIIYCPIRPSSLFTVNLRDWLKDSTLEESPLPKRIGPVGKSLRSPRFSPDGCSLVFLENPVGGPHFRCSRLAKLEFKPDVVGEPRIVIDLVSDWDRRAPKFAGIFTTSLPIRCWSGDGRLLWFHSAADCRRLVYVVETSTGIIWDVEVTDGSQSVVGVFDDVVVIGSSSVTGSYPELFFGATNDAGFVTQWTSCRREELKFEDTTIPMTFEPSSEPRLHYSGLLHLPSPKEGASKCPLIVFPHGGPHSAFVDEFSVYLSGFLRLGFAILQVNYRGSIGQGQSSIDSLPGHVGVNDVKDVQEAVLKVLSDDAASEESARLDPAAVVVFGGSHGGFLTAHLVGQFPRFYKAAVCRNPVTNLTNMLGVTDIPDWTFVEGCGLEYEPGMTPSVDQLVSLLRASPIVYAADVTTPTLVLVGGKDLRVPPSQGIQFYKALKAEGVATELKIFPEDSHPLSRSETEAECFVHIVKWFSRHLSTCLCHK